MSSTGSAVDASGPSPQEPAGENICPRCGHPIRDYQCGCPERWESEGGTLNPGLDTRQPADKGDEAAD